MSGKKFTGVQLRDLDAVVKNYDRSSDTEMAWTRMREEVRPHIDSRLLEQVVERYLDRRFQWNPLYLFGALCETIRPLRTRFRRRWLSNKLFCSELTARVLKDFRLLPRQVDPLNVIPSGFRDRDQAQTMDRDGQTPLLFDDPVIFTACPRRST